MKTRVLLPERMDDPDLDRAEHFRALRGLQRINGWTGNASLFWPPLQELAARLDRSSLRILDVACGGADIPIQLWRRGQRAGLDLPIDVSDASDQALQFATQNCNRAGAPLRLRKLDILQDSIDEEYDAVICSQFLHHLPDAQARTVLGKMKAAAAHRVIVVDLVRSRLNWLQVWLGTRALSRSKVVHFDGPQSIRAAFTVEEIRTIASRIGFSQLSIVAHWPCRFLLVGDVI